MEPESGFEPDWSKRADGLVPLLGALLWREFLAKSENQEEVFKGSGHCHTNPSGDNVDICCCLQPPKLVGLVADYYQTTSNLQGGSLPADPTGVIPNFDNPYSRGETDTAVATAIMDAMFIFVTCKLYTKSFIARKLGWDDCKS